VEKCVSEFDKLIENKDTPIIVMYDVTFSHAAGNVLEQCYLQTFKAYYGRNLTFVVFRPDKQSTE
jgi:hypothetical protein